MNVVVVVTSSSVAQQVLRLLARNGVYRRGISGLARELGVSYSWLHTILTELERQGVVAIDRGRRPYHIRLCLPEGVEFWGGMNNRGMMAAR